MSKKSDIKWHSIQGAEVLIGLTDTSSVKGALYPVGNCSKFEFSEMGDTKTDIQDWSVAGAPLLGSVLKTRIPTFGATLMEARTKNLRMLLMGDESEYTQTASPVTAEALVGGCHVGAIYQLANAPISGTGIAVQTTGGSPVTLVKDTDYTVDLTLGQIEMLLLHAGVTDGAAITCNYTPTALVAGSGYPQILAGTIFQRECSVVVTGYPSKGPKMQLYIPRCMVEADGALAFVSEDPATFGLKFTVLSNTELAGNALFRYRQLAAPTS